MGLPSCSHRLAQLLAVPFRLAGLLLQRLVWRPKGALQLKLLVGKPLGLRLLVSKLLDWRLRGVQLKKLLLLLLPPPLPLPAQTVLISLEMEVTMLECRPLIS